ncbi:hypothetical protein SAMN05421780_101225 [Flexibacter flexilis DSM 6793]|uniref:Uncharacterized protein n=1 Tax=Flexibacter flexilis DSM 6793 TaxID=927664 RepID=A0A1I1DHG1_9BACT|nr:hypothetical protein SAMN05421780_101225 [Flexibacter flexilis DSM 6793]
MPLISQRHFYEIQYKNNAFVHQSVKTLNSGACLVGVNSVIS